MPATAIGALIALLIAPGFLLVRGYDRRQYRSEPDRDVYAVAEAIVASAIWLGIAWVILAKLFSGTVERIGVIPTDANKIEDHPIGVVVLALLLILLPYGVGVLCAVAANRLARATRWPFSYLRWAARRLGFFKVPNAWDRAWAQLERFGAGHVVMKMKDGSFVVGGFGKQSRIDVSPLTVHGVYLHKAHAHASAEYAGGVGKLLNLEHFRDELLADPAFQPVTDEVGVLVDGDEVTAVFFREA